MVIYTDDYLDYPHEVTEYSGINFALNIAETVQDK